MSAVTKKWSHATNSIAQMEKAVNDSSITSIECDVLMNAENDRPILCHPPNRESDITVATCIDMVTKEAQGGHGREILKDIKFDFKEMEAVRPTFDILKNTSLSNPRQKIIILNADILPGPGQRDAAPLDADGFLSRCLEFIRLMEVRPIQFTDYTCCRP